MARLPRSLSCSAQTNPILQDMVFKEGNLPTGMRSTARTSLPGVAFRRVERWHHPDEVHDRPA